MRTNIIEVQYRNTMQKYNYTYTSTHGNNKDVTSSPYKHMENSSSSQDPWAVITVYLHICVCVLGGLQMNERTILFIDVSVSQKGTEGKKFL